MNTQMHKTYFRVLLIRRGTTKCPNCYLISLTQQLFEDGVAVFLAVVLTLTRGVWVIPIHGRGALGLLLGAGQG